MQASGHLIRLPQLATLCHKCRAEPKDGSDDTTRPAEKLRLYFAQTSWLEIEKRLKAWTGCGMEKVHLGGFRGRNEKIEEILSRF